MTTEPDGPGSVLGLRGHSSAEPVQLHPEPEIPKAPRGLKAEGRKLWRQLHRAYTFDDCPERLAILESACRTLDVITRLQAVVDEATDLRVRGSQGQPVSLPEIAEVRQHRALFVSQMKALGLPDEEAPASGGLTRSQIGRLGAQARWRGVSR
jgi:hypothetical protein